MSRGDPADARNEFRYLTEAELPAGQGFGYGYTTVCINVPRYLEALSAEFQQLGGTLVRRRIAHIDEAFGQDTSLVVNCSGLGARTLGGVLDSDVFPIRGQIALIRGQIDHAALTTEHRLQLTDNESSTYVIPRNDGTCVIGGTFIEGDSDMTVRSSTFHAFLGRTAAIHPQIAAWRDHHGVRPGNDDAGVSAHTVGLRPARRGGVRIDAEHKRESANID
nr:hypothetical protein HK105_002308 [Polyrhizophydium stewartii]